MKQSSLTSFMRSPSKQHSPGKQGSPAKHDRLPQLAIRLLDAYRAAQQTTSTPAATTAAAATAAATGALKQQKTSSAPTSPQALQKAASAGANTSAGSSSIAQKHQQQQDSRVKSLMQRCVRQLPFNVLQLMPEPLRATLLQKRAIFDERENMCAQILVHRSLVD